MKVPTFLSITVLAIAAFFINAATIAQSTATRNGVWLQVRGPNGAGVAEGFAMPGEVGSTKNVMWKTAIPFARSSPVVTSDRIFLTATEGDNLITLGFNRSTENDLCLS